MNLLTILPVLLDYLPALIDVIAGALSGGCHRDEGAWCAHVKGLEDVCKALRAKDMSTMQVVAGILSDVNPGALKATGQVLMNRGRS